MGDVGKTVDDDEIELIEIDLDWHAPSPAASAATSSAPARPIWRRALAFGPRWLVLVAVVVYVGWFVTSSGGDDEAAPPSPSTAHTSASTTPPAETVTTEDDRAALGGDPSLDLAAAIETLVAAYDHAETIPMDARAYKFDIVLRGRRATMFENRMEGT